MDILIIGAGPAGSSSAIQLSKAGFGVTMIDNVAFPRFRPGESCHPGIEPLLYQLDVWDEVVALNPIRYNSIVINTNGIERQDFFNSDKSWQGFQFPREKFDLVLLEKAIKLGTRFIEKTQIIKFETSEKRIISIKTNKGDFKFDFVIDATGSKSLTSIKLHLERNQYSKNIISSYYQIMPTSKVAEKLNCYFEITDDYWGYISLIKDHIYSVAFSSCKLQAFYQKHFLQKHFKSDYEVVVAKGFNTSWKLTSNQLYDNLYLVGDALMTFDPTSSKGILKSIMSGIYSAHIITHIKKNILTKMQGHGMYQNWANNFFEKELSSIKEMLPQAIVEKTF